jgi:hypothetical protein
VERSFEELHESVGANRRWESKASRWKLKLEWSVELEVKNERDRV